MGRRVGLTIVLDVALVFAVDFVIAVFVFAVAAAAVVADFVDDILEFRLGSKRMK